MHRPTRRITSAALAAASIGGTAGCASNPFAEDPLDTDTVATRDRLRSIAVFDLERARAQDPTPDGDDADAALSDTVERSRERYEQRESVELSLVEARRAALSNNLGLDATLIAPEIAAERVNQEWAQFESAFTLGASYSETDTPTASTLVGSQGENTAVTPGVRIPLLTGGTATIEIPFRRRATNNPFSTLNPSYEADLELSLSHDLLRGAGRRATTHAIRLAEYDRQISGAQTKLEVISVLASVDRAYWRLYAALEALRVVEQQYEVAIAQLERAQRLLDAGQGTEVDVIRARSGAASRVEAIISAQNDIRLRQRELKRLINIPGLDVETATRLTVSSPPDPIRYAFEPARLTDQALEKRMEMLELEIRLARDAASIGFARNQKLPLLALNYTYRVNGLAGSLGNAVDNASQNNFEDWAVSLNAEFPIGNERAKASLAQSILSRLQTLSTRDARAQTITSEVHDAIDQLESTWQRILATREAVALNTRLLEAERRQFEVGRSTSTDVLDADANLAQARLDEIRAVVDYQIAQIDLAVATGTLLGQARIELPGDRRMDDEDAIDRATEGVPDYNPLSGTIIDP